MLLILATDFDNLQFELSNFEILQTENLINSETITCNVDNESVLFAATGVTKAQFAAAFAEILAKYDISSVICIGNAASLDEKKLKIGNIIICANALQYDVDFQPLGYGIGEIPDTNKSVFFSDHKLIEMAQTASIKSGINFYSGRIISSDSFLASSTQSKKERKMFNAHAADTESGVLLELGYKYNLPCISIKGISNYANDTAETDYNSHRVSSNLKSLKTANKIISLLQNEKS